jgi:hypothetical protein
MSCFWLLVTGYWPEARGEKPAAKTPTPDIQLHITIIEDEEQYEDEYEN